MLCHRFETHMRKQLRVVGVWMVAADGELVDDLPYLLRGDDEFLRADD